MFEPSAPPTSTASANPPVTSAGQPLSTNGTASIASMRDRRSEKMPVRVDCAGCAGYSASVFWICVARIMLGGLLLQAATYDGCHSSLSYPKAQGAGQVPS
ncbi:protein of unknown function [Sterolibacterium denitrificans]|uniref:Uncharacterized protein n=1 Tax=Sterolibacterium denitrificans TaxID=157592 RepID=A0A7Z7HS61_9PROT|nr:protein of unknown function [Sterolibacterium denitrificans]